MAAPGVRAGPPTSGPTGCLAIRNRGAAQGGIAARQVFSRASLFGQASWVERPAPAKAPGSIMELRGSQTRGARNLAVLVCWLCRLPPPPRAHMCAWRREEEGCSHKRSSGKGCARQDCRGMNRVPKDYQASWRWMWRVPASICGHTASLVLWRGCWIVNGCMSSDLDMVLSQATATRWVPPRHAAFIQAVEQV